MPNHKINIMSTPQCDECGLYTCEHKTQLIQEITTVDHSSLGENIGDPLSNANTATKIRVNVEPDISGNIICKGCEKLVSKGNYCYRCGYKLSISGNIPDTKIEVEKEPATKNLKNDLTIKCSYCDTDVMKRYIAAHLKMHINDHTPPPEPEKMEQSPIVKIETPTNLIVKSSLGIAADGTTFFDKDDVSLKSIDRFHYRKIENISVSGSSSSDKRFSDFTVVVWLEDRLSAYSGHYAGGSWRESKEAERVVINTTFDTIDEYYSVSVKLLKTNQHGYTSSDEIPERLCFDATEISEEIKRGLLFFKVPPKSVYKRFRKAMRFEEFMYEFDDNGRIEYVQTVNSNDLMAQLKTKQIPSHTYNSKNTPYHGCG